MLHESGEIVGQASAAPAFGQIAKRMPRSDSQGLYSGGGVGKRIAAGQFAFVGVGVELHLAEHEATDAVAGVHQGPKDFAGKPHSGASGVQDNADAQINALGGRFEPDVPLIAFINDSGEPMIHLANDVREAHARALSEVTELMGEHAGELAHVQSGNKGKTNGEREIVAEKAEDAFAKSGRCIDIVVYLNVRGCGRADQ